MTKAGPVESLGKIAVVGMTCRLPGARTCEEFWQNLHDGKETVKFFSDQELLAKGVDPSEFSQPNFVKARGYYEDTYKFDARFFGYTPRESELIDPQQRVFLECAWEALEDAGYDPIGSRERIGLFGGVGCATHLIQLLTNPAVRKSVDMMTLATSNDKDYLATRIGYKLNLRGPCVTVQTACSTSLVAIILACQSLMTYQSDVALAGGVTLDSNESGGYYYEEGGIASPDGHCRTFDASAKGTVFGNGAGIVVLKRLEDALADRDTIHAVVIGYGLNNDGSSKVGFTAPGVEGQVAVSSEAIAMAGVNPETITYVECHGTATPMGDPIEIAALTRSFRAYTQKKGFCAVGSVKSNLGHVDAAAGVAGFIKTVLALENKQIPASLHYTRPNPEIDFENSPFYVNTALAAWDRSTAPRRASQNSFGIGGTNAHVILEEAPEVQRSAACRSCELLVWSAKTSSAADKMTQRLAEHLRKDTGAGLADVAYTLHVGRALLPHRRMLVCRDREDALRALESVEPGRIIEAHANKKATPVCFLFPGQGAQYVNMGKGLYDTESTFREEVDRCAVLLKPHLGFDLRDLLYPSSEQLENSAELLLQTANTQPAVFVIEYALARLWMKWGIQPSAMIGHSIGEYVAACLADVFSLEEALALVSARGRLMQALLPGAMVGVLMAEEEIVPILQARKEISLAAVNAANSCVLAGPIPDIADLENELEEKGLPYRRLQTSHAFHSAMMDPILDPFRKLLEKTTLHAPRSRYISNVTGDWITAAEATNPDYWVRHLRHAVRFHAGVDLLLQEPGQVLLEVGPGRVLGSLVARDPRKSLEQQILASLADPQNNLEGDFHFLIGTVGRLWLEGVALDWAEFYRDEQRGRIPLPMYPFEGDRYCTLSSEGEEETGVSTAHLSKKQSDLAKWFYHPSWKRAAPLQARKGPSEDGSWLLFLDQGGLGEHLATTLKNQGADVVSVRAGEHFQEDGRGGFIIDPRDKDHYVALVADLRRSGKNLSHVVHLWGLTPGDHPQREIDCIEPTLRMGFYSLLYLAQAIGSQFTRNSMRLHVVANNVHDVAGEKVGCPSKATMLGPVKAISRECPNIHSQLIDIDMSGSRISQHEVTTSLLAEFAAADGDEVVAHRGGHRWIQVFEPFDVQPSSDDHSKLREEGVYLISGGLGGIGMVLAEYLASAVHAKLVLFSRSPFPARDAWDHWLESHSASERTSLKIGQLRRMEEMGSEVHVFSADVTDREQMQGVIQKVKQMFGAIHGVIHSAGVPGTGIMDLKTRESAQSVLAPKVWGTVVLDELLQNEQLDFFVLCSSLTAFFGMAGQADYISANAFLDAFAFSRRNAGGTPPISINWDRWNEVGMAVEGQHEAAGHPSDRATAQDRSDCQPFDHPVFTGRCQIDGEEIFVGSLSPDDHWLVGEHRIMGIPTLVGTGYLEFARAALSQHMGPGIVEWRDIVFVTPLMVSDGEKRSLELALKPCGDGFEFEVRSRADNSAWQVHALGKIGYVLEGSNGGPYDIAALLSSFSVSNEAAVNQSPLRIDAEHIVKAGPRWQCIVAIAEKPNEGLAILNLADEFSGDLEQFELHPALLDCATSFAMAWATRGAVYLPCSYDRIRMSAPLSRKLYCHAHYIPAGPEDEVVTVDVEIFDEHGRLLVEVDGYSFKKVPEHLLNAWNGRSSGQQPASPVPVSVTRVGVFKPGEWGILSSEGIDIFLRVLSLAGTPQIAIASVDLNWFAAQVKSTADTGQLETKSAVTSLSATHPRPNLATPYVAPRTELEQSIAGVWQSLAGISEVGIYDNFAELGGHSLMAVQLMSRIRELFEVDLSVAKFYKNPTVVGLAEQIVQTLAEQLDSETITLALQELQSTTEIDGEKALLSSGA